MTEGEVEKMSVCSFWTFSKSILKKKKECKKFYWFVQLEIKLGCMWPMNQNEFYLKPTLWT